MFHILKDKYNIWEKDEDEEYYKELQLQEYEPKTIEAQYINTIKSCDTLNELKLKFNEYKEKLSMKTQNFLDLDHIKDIIK